MLNSWLDKKNWNNCNEINKYLKKNPCFLPQRYFSNLLKVTTEVLTLRFTSACILIKMCVFTRHTCNFLSVTWVAKCRDYFGNLILHKRLCEQKADILNVSLIVAFICAAVGFLCSFRPTFQVNIHVTSRKKERKKESSSPSVAIQAGSSPTWLASRSETPGTSAPRAARAVCCIRWWTDRPRVSLVCTATQNDKRQSVRSAPRQWKPTGSFCGGSALLLVIALMSIMTNDSKPIQILDLGKKVCLCICHKKSCLSSQRRQFAIRIIFMNHVRNIQPHCAFD